MWSVDILWYQNWPPGSSNIKQINSTAGTNYEQRINASGLNTETIKSKDNLLKIQVILDTSTPTTNGVYFNDLLLMGHKL